MELGSPRSDRSNPPPPAGRSPASASSATGCSSARASAAPCCPRSTCRTRPLPGRSAASTSPGSGEYLHPVGGDRALIVGRTLRVQPLPGGDLFHVGVHTTLVDLAAAPVVVSTWAQEGLEPTMLNDHHAFTWWPSRSVAAFPVSERVGLATVPRSAFVTVTEGSVTGQPISPSEADLGPRCPRNATDRSSCDSTGLPTWTASWWSTVGPGSTPASRSRASTRPPTGRWPSSRSAVPPDRSCGGAAKPANFVSIHTETVGIDWEVVRCQAKPAQARGIRSGRSEATKPRDGPSRAAQPCT